VSERRQHSLRYNWTIFSKLQTWYNTYRGVWQGRLAQFRNNVNIPFTFAMIQSDVARKVQASFGVWPIVTFEGYAPEDAARAKKSEVLISAQMKDCDSIIRAVDFFLQADICGVGIARYGWKNVTRRREVRRMEEVAPGLRIPVMDEVDAVLFDGPDWEPIDRLDFWQQPGKRRIQDMGWVIHRYWRDLDDLLEDAQGPYPYFDPRAVKLLQQTPLATSAQQEFMARKLTFRNEFDYMARQRERFAKPVEIWEMHGTVPMEFAPDGIRNRCIAIGNGRVVLKNDPSIFADKPFLAYSPMPDPYGFDSPGKAEIAEKLQRTADRLANQKLDALDLIIDPQYVVSSTANLNTQNLFSRAGRILLVDGPADDSNIRPLIPPMQGFQAAYPEISTLYQYMQLGLGINDIIMGAGGESRETARGVLARQENVMTRLALEARIAEEQFIEPLADAFRQLDQRFLEVPHERAILGSIMDINPTTGYAYPQERVSIQPEDLTPDYRARAIGASQMIGRSQRQQNLVGLLQIMSSNPAMLQLINWANFARQAFELFDFKNVDDLLVQVAEGGAAPAVNQLAAQSGSSPGATMTAASTPLDQLSPEILGQMVASEQPAPQNHLLGVGA
jgi:hypothetical protein